MFQKVLSGGKLWRNYLFNIFRALVPIVLLSLFGTTLFYDISAAESDREKRVFNMFFDQEDLFISVTRNPKPISQIAENTTIVTAEEIEAMNAHSVAEVLNRVTGFFINFSQGAGALGSTSILNIQGSEQRHVLVLLDGIPWNSIASGAAEINTVPVGIIERIEIIKGPASSSWGSSLGGVVHIITKSAGYLQRPTGSVQASYGEHDAQDYRAQISGRNRRLGYYFYGGRQASQGPDDARDFYTNSYYSKLSYTLSGKAELGFSIGYSEPDIGLGNFASVDLNSSGEERSFWTSLMLDANLNTNLTFNVHLFRYEHKSIITNRALGLGYRGPQGSLFQQSGFDETTTGGSAKFVWENDMHTAVFGMDYSHGDLDQTIDSGQNLQAIGAPPSFHTNPDVKKTGIFLNDTIVFKRLSITPGIRYDHHSKTDSFISPSLGATYRVGMETIVRGSVSRGFTSPPLSWTDGGSLFLSPNSSLDEESVWSYQVGMESAALKWVWIKGTLFRHEIDDVFKRQPTSDNDPQSIDQIFVNSRDSRRHGFAVQAQTLPSHNTSIQAGVVYVDLNPANNEGATEIYSYKFGITYDNPRICRAELFGHYIWWDEKVFPDADYDDVIWDLNVSKGVYKGDRIGADLFLTIHNLFNGSQYLDADNENPDRWVEGGLRINF